MTAMNSKPLAVPAVLTLVSVGHYPPQTGAVKDRGGSTFADLHKRLAYHHGFPISRLTADMPAKTITQITIARAYFCRLRNRISGSSLVLRKYSAARRE